MGPISAPRVPPKIKNKLEAKGGRTGRRRVFPNLKKRSLLLEAKRVVKQAAGVFLKIVDNFTGFYVFNRRFDCIELSKRF